MHHPPSPAHVSVGIKRVLRRFTDPAFLLGPTRLQHSPRPGACERRCLEGFAIIERCSACAFLVRPSLCARRWTVSRKTAFLAIVRSTVFLLPLSPSTRCWSTPFPAVLPLDPGKKSGGPNPRPDVFQPSRSTHRRRPDVAAALFPAVLTLEGGEKSGGF